jgi:uncharacterized membrane protein
MKTKTVVIITALLCLAVLGLGLILAPRFPDPMVVHWNAAGEADGYGSRFTGIWMIPLMTVGLAFLLIAMPKIDPLKKNIAAFRGEFNLFILLFAVFMVYIQVLSLLSNLGRQFNMLLFMLPAMAAFYYFIGVMLAKAKRNYFIGIRTPWTLADDQTWDITHKAGAKAFKIGALITLLGLLLPAQAAIWFVMLPLLGAAFFAVVYSYFVYRRLHPDGDETEKP